MNRLPISPGLAMCIAVSAALLTFAVVVNRMQAAPVNEMCDLSFTGGIRINGVPVARTEGQQAAGLSKRSDIGPGMLFAFDPPGKLSFWMKDTSVPLSIAFIAADGSVFRIEDMEPNTLEHHLSVLPAQYALEVPQGSFGRTGIFVGSRLVNVHCMPRPAAR